MYNSYCGFCREKKIAPESVQSFSRKLTNAGFQNKQVRRDKKKEYYWIDVKIQDWRAIEDSKQETLTELIEEQRGKLK